ncbi:ShlB/FhaC/HecB family hemolysin secretion/activation protein [Funiculus sociatus GB1-A4]|nr:ShlB/FhaC/HecB family hemolysin secretion/activation protein [Trichocoleus sp. FACHB-40]
MSAQTLDLAQAPNRATPIPPALSAPPPQDLRQPSPSPTPVPQTPSLPPPPPEELLPSPTSPSTAPERPPNTIDTITVTKFEFAGNSVFTSEELAERVTAGLINKPLSLSRLLQIASDVANLYKERGYSTSGAKVFIPLKTQRNRTGIVEIQVIEGELEEIKVIPVGSQRLNPNYVRSRLAVAGLKPLNVDRLQEGLQLLRLNPLIEQLSAQLSDGSAPGKSVLEVQVKEANSFSTPLSTNNGRSPSAGSFQRRVGLNEANLLGLGDGLSLGYTNTDGSNGWDASYTLPLNPRNGTLSFSYSTTSSSVIEPPFNRLDINANSRTYEVTLRQPIIQTIKQQTFQEFALGLTASRRESENSLLGIPFPLSPGADDQGRTRISALRFSQEWTQQNSKEVIAVRSQFSLGLDAFGSTINEPIPGVEAIPDSRFFSWQGQAQWVRLLAPETLLLVRANAQLADRALVPSEQFAIGGFGSLRGYRQDTLLTDNGIFASTEVQLPILYAFSGQGVLQLIPFVDYGIAWNSSGAEAPNPNTLAAVGLGLQWRQGNRFTARLDWGIPLVSVKSRERTWQENGLYFSVQYNPF